jgi:hypothetical protein
MRTALRQLGCVLALAISLLPCPASAANKDLVILHSERWIDTIKGTLKNVSSDRAEEVVVVVRFFGEPGTTAPPRRPHRSARRMELGQQTAKIRTLEPGQETPFELEIAEKYRKATSFKFEPHAIWGKGRGGRSPRR